MCRKYLILVLLAALFGILILVSADGSELGQESLHEQVKNHPLVKLLGADYSTIKKTYGNPKWEGGIPETGAYWYSYGRLGEETLFGFANPKEGKVLGIYYKGKEDISGVAVGMTLNEIKGKWGKPSKEYYNVPNLMDDTINSVLSYVFEGIIDIYYPSQMERRKFLKISFEVHDPSQPIRFVKIDTVPK